MKKWLKLVAGGIIALAFLSLTGCRKQDASSNKKVTIEFFNQKREMQATLKKMIKKFEKEHPNIRVKETDVPSAGDVLKVRMLSGDAPDVINTYPQNLDYQTWAKVGYFVDMTHKSYIKNIVNNYAEKFAINGKIYNAPLSANLYGFYYNATEFEKLGLKIPQTWSELEHLVKEIKAKGKTPFAIAGTEPWTLNGYHNLSLATVTGGFNQAENLIRYSPVNSISLNNKYIQADIQRLDLLRGNGQKNWKGASYNDAVMAFTSGKALIMPQGSWALAVIKTQNPKFKIRTFAFPGNKPGQEMTVGSGDMALSISSRSKHKKAADEFLKFMCSPEAMQMYYDQDGSPCTIKGVKQKGIDSELGGLSKYAFTKKHMVGLGQKWTTENDFFNLTGNYVLTGDKKQLISDFNTTFNPMKATN